MNWACGGCTVLNQEAATICEVCTLPRYTVDPDDIRNPKCVNCTFVNSEGADMCKLCDTLLARRGKPNDREKHDVGNERNSIDKAIAYIQQAEGARETGVFSKALAKLEKALKIVRESENN